MKSVNVNDDLELDLGLSIGRTYRNFPEKSTGLRLFSRMSGGSDSSSTLVSDGDEDSGVTDAKNRGQIRRREEERNPPLKRAKKLEEGAGSECVLMINNVDLNKRDSAVQMVYPYSSLQYVPFMNGYAFPSVMPYWTAGAAAEAVVGRCGERTLHQPVARRSFRPFENECQLEQSGSNNRKSGSCGSSPVCSSSVISDNHQSSSSHEGGGSSYTRSNSSNSSSNQRQKPNLNSNESVNDHPSLNHVKPKPCNRTQCEEKFVESHVCKTTTTIKKEPIIASEKDQVVVPMPTTTKSGFDPLKSSMKNMKMENGKPPKPQIHTRNVPNLHQMPCVSTTGVGPNAKTITGFLYRFSNLEVSILCVCHGESFSPSEFVKHAGGGEVSHPLRHITVLPTYGIPSTIR